MDYRAFFDGLGLDLVGEVGAGDFSIAHLVRRTHPAERVTDLVAKTILPNARSQVRTSRQRRGHLVNDAALHRAAEGAPGIARFRDLLCARELCLLVDFIPGNHLQQYGPLSPAGRDRLDATVRALHERRIAGLDLRGPNVVVDYDGMPWLVDLGGAARYAEFDRRSFERAREFDRLKLDALLEYGVR